MMRLFPQTLAARTLAALTLGFAVLFVGMVAIHDVLLRQAAERGMEELLAKRIATLVDAVAAVPAEYREAVARSLSRSDVEVNWYPGVPPTGTGERGEDWARVAERIEANSRDVTQVTVTRGGTDPLLGHATNVGATVSLVGGSSLRVSISTFAILSADQRALHAYAAGIGLVLLLAVGFAARSISAPVSDLAKAVARMDPDRDPPSLPTSGPLEVRQLSDALTGMAARTRDAFRQRTLALGALSHDLMSPIARLRLRAEELAEDDRAPILSDLTEMETMVGDVLAYLRAGHDGEPLQLVVVAALVSTVINEFADVGQHVEERRMDDSLVVQGRRIAIKRAITNLVANALRHGREPWIEVEATGEDVLVRVGDKGPGIPPGDLPRVTEPFFRGDRARTAGGGSGLGLATVRAIAEDHGGELTIASTLDKGTIATIRLPSRSASPSLERQMPQGARSLERGVKDGRGPESGTANS
nr:ATP-binding protein [uncultured Roseococcus sp.]